MKNDMRVRRGGSDRLIRRFIAGTVLLMLLLLGGRYIGRAAGSIPRNDYRRMIKAGGQWLVETIWIQAQPGKRISGEGGGDPYVGQADPDPSYRKYQAVKTFYQEHQYPVSYTHLRCWEYRGQRWGPCSWRPGWLTRLRISQWAVLWMCADPERTEGSSSGSAAWPGRWPLPASSCTSPPWRCV